MILFYYYCIVKMNIKIEKINDENKNLVVEFEEEFSAF